MKKIISLILLMSLALLAIACNIETEQSSEALVSDTFGEELTEENTAKSTTKSTDKNTEKTENETSRPIKQTEPPTMLDSTDGLDLNIKVLSQNVRCADDEGNNSVKERTTRFKALLDEYKPDLVGTQEVTMEWLLYLRSIEGYEVIGSSRDGHRSMSGEWSAIMYNSERFVLMDSDTFWLTDTPDKVSAVKNSGCRRICTWAELFDRYTGETIIMANTHLDHLATDVRVTQANYLLLNLRKRLAERYEECRIYLTGDFNCTPNSTPYFTVTNCNFVDAHTVALEDISTVTGSFHGYGEHNSEIDFCFFKGEETVLSYEIISKKYIGEMDTEPGFVSDHYGVITVFERKVAD